MTTNNYLKNWQKNPYRNLWQHPVWAKFQQGIGRQTWLLETSGASALVVKHKLPKGLSWLEIPRGPLFEDEKSLNEILKKVTEIGKKEGSLFVRFSPYQEVGSRKQEVVVSKYDNQPETSLILDLNQPEEEILKQMKSKGRYNIKVAQKNGVTIKPSDNIEDFYSILSTTANRDDFGIHPKSYYQKMLDHLGENGQLLVAEYEGSIIAGGIFVYLNDWGIYYYGASDNAHRNLMAPYLIQWKAIKEAKSRGCQYYDFLGIAPDDNEKHAWAGVTQFKKKFGGKAVSYPKAKEIILRPFWYWLYQIYKKLR